MDTAGGGVDGDIAHPGQVEGQTPVGEGRAGDVVPTAFDAQQQLWSRANPTATATSRAETG